jgi:hypothetical protein
MSTDELAKSYLAKCEVRLEVLVRINHKLVIDLPFGLRLQRLASLSLRTNPEQGA